MSSHETRKMNFLRSYLRAAVAAMLCVFCMSAGFDAAKAQGSGETIVLIRHGEKPPGGLGQLTCKGLNRALALPDLLVKRYGTPDFIYAPNPSVQVKDGHDQPTFSYVRPLATIEPTAIRLGMPVNTQIGYSDIGALQTELTQPAHANSLIFVAWEHLMLYQFARQMLQSGGKDPSVVPEWPQSDYDTIYVFHIAKSGDGRQMTFKIEKEMLDNSLKDSCPTP